MKHQTFFALQRQFLCFFVIHLVNLIYCPKERRTSTERTEQAYVSQTPNKKETISISFDPAEQC